MAGWASVVHLAWDMPAVTALLFATIGLLWGFTWFAIKLQLGVVPMTVSICLRFVVAALALWLGLAVTGRLRRVRPAQHLGFAGLGLCLFGLNFLLIYQASRYVPSGVVSVLFTTATLFNAFNQWLFQGKRPAGRVVAGAVLGTAGIALLFAPEVAQLRADDGTPLGIAMALGGTYVFSLGNLISQRTRAGGTDLPNAVVRGMTWGAAFLALAALASGQSLAALPLWPGWTYALSLLYLAIPGSVAGFLVYLSLVGRVGADRAAYATVLFPLVALAVSTWLEGYVWTPAALIGLPLILLGNLVIFARLPAGRARLAQSTR